MQFDKTKDAATGDITYRLTITGLESRFISESDDAEYIAGYFERDRSTISNKLDGLAILARVLERAET